MSIRSALLRTIATMLLAGTSNAVGAPRPVSVPITPTVTPAIDVPAPAAVFVADGADRVGGMATRVELSEPALNVGLSSWYRLAYRAGGDRLQVFESYFPTEDSPQADVVESQVDAWRFATELVGPPGVQLPAGARVRTGEDYGSSTGLVFTLTYLDVLSPGALVGDLRVAATGGIGSDGRVFPVAHVEVKVAAALLTHPDVVFTPRASRMTDSADVVSYVSTNPLGTDESPADWLRLAAYRQAGGRAAQQQGATAFVVVHDVRQVLAWLCGRTGGVDVCGLADAASGLPIPAGRSW